MAKWFVEIVNKTIDVVVVEAKNDDDAVLKGQQSLYRVREKQVVEVTATEWKPDIPPRERFTPADVS